MKKILSLFLLISLITSCTKEVEHYSCNTSIDQKVKTNIESIHKMSRSAWKQIPDIEYKHAVYVAFTPKQKQTFWIERFQEILELDWTYDERKHIQDLFNFIKENREIFEDNEGLSDEVLIYIYKWSEFAMEKLDWNQSTISLLTSTGYELKKEKTIVKIKDIAFDSFRSAVFSHANDQTDSEACNCHVGNVLFTSCPLSLQWCESGGCVTAVHGCGAFWVESCNGACK